MDGVSRVYDIFAQQLVLEHAYKMRFLGEVSLIRVFHIDEISQSIVLQNLLVLGSSDRSVKELFKGTWNASIQVHGGKKSRFLSFWISWWGALDKVWQARPNFNISRLCATLSMWRGVP